MPRPTMGFRMKLPTPSPTGTLDTMGSNNENNNNNQQELCGTGRELGDIKPCFPTTKTEIDIKYEKIKTIPDSNEIIREYSNLQNNDLENLKNKNLKFTPHKIQTWLDFGTPKTLLASHKELLITQKIKYQDYPNTIIKPPCFIDSVVEIRDSKIGPNVSIGKDTIITSSEISDTIIQSNCSINNANLKNSIIGNFVDYDQNYTEINIGDYSTLKKTK